MGAEFARDRGKFQDFHTATFSAYFSLGLDIGDLDVLAQIADSAGLDPGAMKQAVQAGKYISRLEEIRQEAGVFGITGVPTFTIEGREPIVGAQPLDVFRKALRSR